ncbi:deoxyuridine 5'-triphosphate nucleotidohydrolase [bacterium]|nr:deoxyuridine 5'-triphosphate nucleotidohydrolase [bacterium]
MKKILKFEKVSFEQFSADCSAAFGDTDRSGLREIYDGIAMPKRATAGSAGYDFFLPEAIRLPAGKSILIPTGIRAQMPNDWALFICPRSGLGFKFRFQLDNTIGIIDSDYYDSSNEGHIMAKLTNDSREGKELRLEAGKAFIQGVFLPYGITDDDAAGGKRTGGFGSTG